LPKDTGVKAQVDEFIARWAKIPVKTGMARVQQVPPAFRNSFMPTHQRRSRVVTTVCSGAKARRENG
jgi:hypothetical protein